MQLPEKKKFTYSDYVKWNDGNRYELIDGSVYMMSPAPSSNHQRLSGALFAQFHNYLKGKKCEVFSAPFDVRLNFDTEDNIVVQPDISIVCDPDKIDERGCKGAPDMIVEILSPATARRDQFIKFNKYLENGVCEYWIVNPEERFVEVNILQDGGYFSKVYGDTATISTSVLEDCCIDLSEVFPVLPPEEEPKSPENS